MLRDTSTTLTNTRKKFMQVKPYTAAYREMWNTFVHTSRNATFLHDRHYMEYHAERFEEVSAMVMDGDKGNLFALFPATYHAATKMVCSHAGLTYGDFLLSRQAHAPQVLAAMGAILDYYRQMGAQVLRLKTIPSIYHRFPADEVQYFLFREKAKMVACGLSTAVDLASPLPYSTLRQRGVKKAEKAKYGVKEAVLDDATAWSNYWEVLTQTLHDRHQVQPVHTLDEIRLLAQRFPLNIRLYTVCDVEGNVVAGTVLYLTDTVAHTQYIAASEVGRQHGALDLLMTTLLRKVPVEYPALRHFDFGVSTENDGNYLNEGLLMQKEGFGGRSVTYPTYEIHL